MKIIVAVDEKWGIGKGNNLLFSLPKDMMFFREKTINNIVVMGSNTLKSMKDGKPLPYRTNVVLYPGGEKRDDCIICDSLEELKETLAGFDTDKTYICGGAMFYKTMLPYCDEAYITKVNADGGATVFFENLDELDNWKMVSQGDKIETNGKIIRFTVYKNSAPKKFI